MKVMSGKLLRYVQALHDEYQDALLLVVEAAEYCVQVSLGD